MNQAGADADAALIRWSSPQCPFVIDYPARVLDDIRLAIVDAFCSLPRGGAEIGGVLLGVWEPGCLRITGYAPLECEHAYGPSFTLSPNDEGRLRDLIAHPPADPAGQVPVGWYHSHTRSEIFLSDVDLSIHERFFPEPWQVALVLKPQMMRPTRAGFFFRESSGAMQITSAYQEFPLEPQPFRPVPAVGSVAEMPAPEGGPRTLHRERNSSMGVAAEPALVVPPEAPLPPPVVVAPPPPAPPPPPPPAAVPVVEEHVWRHAPAPEPVEALPDGRASDLEREDSAAPDAAAAKVDAGPATVPEADPVAPPQFLSTREPRNSRRWALVLLIVVLAGGAGAGLYYTHSSWLPQMLAAVRPTPVVRSGPPAVGLNTVEREGQLQINWDRGASAVRSAVEATLEITDGPQLPQSISLDQPHLQNGFFTYGRQFEKVDVKLVLQQPDGTQVREATTFLGKLPERRAPEDNADARKQHDDLVEKAAKLEKDLEKESARTRRLEKEMKGMKDDMQKAQKSRMTNMLPEGK